MYGDARAGHRAAGTGHLALWVDDEVSGFLGGDLDGIASRHADVVAVCVPRVDAVYQWCTEVVAVERHGELLVAPFVHAGIVGALHQLLHLLAVGVGLWRAVGIIERHILIAVFLNLLWVAHGGAIGFDEGVAFLLGDGLVLFFRLRLVVLVVVGHEEPIGEAVAVIQCMAHLVGVVGLVRVMVGAGDLKAVELRHRIALCKADGVRVGCERDLRHALVDAQDVLVGLDGILVLVVIIIKLSIDGDSLLGIGYRVVVDTIVAEDRVPALMIEGDRDLVVVGMVVDIGQHFQCAIIVDDSYALNSSRMLVDELVTRIGHINRVVGVFGKLMEGVQRLVGSHQVGKGVVAFEHRRGDVVAKLVLDDDVGRIGRLLQLV